MAVLAQAQQAEFARLKELTGTSDSVMSKHLSALADAGLIKLTKATSGGRQRTWAAITRTGRTTFNHHVAALQKIVAGG
jgi:DNA-binding transcriptional ArsR family regulator